ncbi:hypothetical protein QQF64_001845 [Cirrhinus molitorella]|uniref:Uncharacterized protein n=1 Tax=Cirrhinus molitorella TaxID=172907 RepID=A0ABR3MNL9_9TELE
MWHLSGCRTTVERISRQDKSRELENRAAGRKSGRPERYVLLQDPRALCGDGRSRGGREGGRAIYSMI